MKHKFSIYLLILCIAACSEESGNSTDSDSTTDSDSDSDTDTDFDIIEGIWLGAFVSDDTGHKLINVNAVVSPEDGKVYFIGAGPNEGAIYAQGTLNLQGENVTSTLVTSNKNGAPVGNISLSAQLVYAGDNWGFQGTYEGNAESGNFQGTGSVSFAYMRSLYEHETSISDIAYEWTSIGDESTQLAIDTNGSITGGNGECLFEGQVELYSPDYNLAHVDFHISNCQSPWDGSYTGMLYGTNENNITITISKNDFGFVLHLNR